MPDVTDGKRQMYQATGCLMCDIIRCWVSSQSDNQRHECLDGFIGRYMPDMRSFIFQIFDVDVFTTLQSDPWAWWPLRHLIRVMRRWPEPRKTITKTKTKTMTKENTFRNHLQRAFLETNTNTKTMTKTNTFREHLQRALLEAHDLRQIWSQW